MLSILSYNIQFGKNLEGIIEWLTPSTRDIDIFCFQEFPFEQIQPFLQRLKLNTFHYEFAATFIENNKAHGQLTVFNTRKMKLLDSEVITFGATFIEGKIIFRDKVNRSSLIVMVKYKGKNVIVSNNHLACIALNFSRRKQIAQILSFLNTVQDTGDTPSILLGDFNYTSLLWQKTLINFMQEKGYINAYRQKTHKLWGRVPQQLDYVFYRNCRVGNIEIHKIPLSDHYPVRFDVEL